LVRSRFSGDHPVRSLLSIALLGLVLTSLGASGPTHALTSQQVQQLLADDGAAGDLFGFSVSIDGDTALIGAFWDDDNGFNSGSAYVFTRTSGTWSQQAKLTADDGAEGDSFGRSVSIDGDTALIGAGESLFSSDTGSAYVFTRTGGTWSQQAKLTADDAAAGDRFGFSVSIDGDTALIGASESDDAGFKSGSAYVFTRTGSTWNQQAKLTADDAAALGRFGFSVSIDGDTALIGAPKFDDGAAKPSDRYEDGEPPGSAYVFTRTSGTWNQQAELTADDAAEGDWFGLSVSIDGDTALIGAHVSVGLSSRDSGSAYVFTRTSDTWNQQAKLAADDAVGGVLLGISVSIDGDTALIGATQKVDDGFTSVFTSGSAYVFTRTSGTWSQLTKLTVDDAEKINSVGSSVALDGDTALIGASDFNSGSGSAYAFDVSGDGDATCGRPFFQIGVSRGLFVWQDCSDRGIRVIGLGGSGSASYRGVIASGESLSAPSSSTLESGDSATLAPSGRRIDFSLTLGGGWDDDFTYFASAGSCLEVRARSADTGVFVGPNGRAVSGAFDPATGAPCTLPETGDEECGAPALGAEAAGLYVWQECDGTWRVLLTGYDEKGGSVAAVGAIESAATISGVQALSLEPGDRAERESAGRVAFGMRTISPWSDAFSFATEDAEAGPCIDLQGLSGTLEIRLGRAQKVIGARRFDASTGGSC